MSSAFNPDGDVTRVQGTPWGAIRNGILHLKNGITNISKLTLNGVTYDFQRQAKEGLVVCGYHYENVTFFLPTDDNEVSAFTNRRSLMTINDYFKELAYSDYGNIPAWNNFMKAFSELLHSYESMLNLQSISYTVTSLQDSTLTASGNADLSQFTDVKGFFLAIYNSLPSIDAPINFWLEPDDTVAINFASLNNTSINMYIGRK